MKTHNQYFRQHKKRFPVHVRHFWPAELPLQAFKFGIILTKDDHCRKTSYTQPWYAYYLPPTDQQAGLSRREEQTFTCPISHWPLRPIERDQTGAVWEMVISRLSQALEITLVNPFNTSLTSIRRTDSTCAFPWTYILPQGNLASVRDGFVHYFTCEEHRQESISVCCRFASQRLWSTVGMYDLSQLYLSQKQSII